MDNDNWVKKCMTLEVYGRRDLGRPKKTWEWKAWNQGGGKEQYLQAKRNAKRTVYTAKKTAEEKKFSDLKPGMDDIFKIAKQLRKDNQDVVGDRCVKR